MQCNVMADSAHESYQFHPSCPYHRRGPVLSHVEATFNPSTMAGLDARTSP